MIPSITKLSGPKPAKSLSKEAAYQAIRRLCKKNSRGARKVSDAIAKQFLKGGHGQQDLIKAYQKAGGDADPWVLPIKMYSFWIKFV